MTPAEHLSAAATRLRELANDEDGQILELVLADPPVALALADWLEAETEHVASYDCMAHCEPAGCDRGHRALALAALIVPEAAEVES